MGDRSNIEWTEATWNPVTGCSKVSPGCDNCYAISMSARLADHPAYKGVVADGDWTGRINLLPERLDQPLRWKKPRRIFVNSMSDLFHPDVPEGYIALVFAIMAAAEHQQFQVLTKRPQRMAKLLTDPEWVESVKRKLWDLPRRDLHAGWSLLTRNGAGDLDWLDGHWPSPNVWLGTSIELDKYTFRARHLVETPAAVRFLSLEPLLGPLPSLDLAGIDWVIVGGESGPSARPMNPEWVRDLRDRSVEAGVAFFFKQWGEWTPNARNYKVSSRRSRYETFAWADDGSVYNAYQPPVGHFPSHIVYRVGKKAAARELDGRTWDEYPPAAEVVYR